MSPDPAQRLLIVTADDYGLTDGTSRAILRAHREGVVSATSVLCVGPAFDRTARWLHDAPTLAVGLHLAAVGEDPPVLPAAEIPTLVDRKGRFPASWRGFVARAAARRIDPADLARELGAQAARARDAGLRITHVNTHQHLHLLPMVRDVVIELARSIGAVAVRVPRSRRIRPTGRGVRVLARSLAERVRAAGLAHTAGFVGLDDAGTLDHRGLPRALAALAASGAPTAELCVHPGEPDDPARERYQWGYRFGDELAALIAPETREVIRAHGFSLGAFDDIAAFRVFRAGRG